MVFFSRKQLHSFFVNFHFHLKYFNDDLVVMTLGLLIFVIECATSEVFIQNITSCYSLTLHMLINVFPTCLVKVLDGDWCILVSLYGHILL